MSNHPDPGNYAQRVPETSQPWHKTYRAALIGISASVVLGLLMFSGQGGDNEIAPTATPSPVVSATQTPAVAASTPTPTPTPKPVPTTSEPTVAATTKAPSVAAAPPISVSKKNAIRSAESYLDYSGFSKKGLIKQLEYEGYSTADATYAVEHITVDWNTQAERSAKAYMDLSAFSRQGLIDQLEYEGYTTSQAQHGASSVGL